MRSAIEHLLTQPEGKTLEFKRDLSSPRNLLKTLVAFANSAGGIVLIGVADDRAVIGLEQPLDDEERLDNLIGDAIAPRLVPNVEILSWQDRSILAVEVFRAAIGLTTSRRKAAGRRLCSPRVQQSTGGISTDSRVAAYLRRHRVRRNADAGPGAG